MKLILVWMIAAVIAAPAEAAKRSSTARHDFQRMHPCPSTGQHRGSCPGWIIDHVVPLCAAGLDAPTNMQWQTLAESKIKDREEWKLCRRLRKIKSA